MKKLLMILSSIGIIASSTTLVVACDPYEKEKIDLNSYAYDNNLSFIDKQPDEQDILDQFNLINGLNLNLNIDVMVENITQDSAIIIAQRDSALYTGSIKVKFTVKKDLNNYPNKDFGALDKKPDAKKILELFNNANKLNLVMYTDVTITNIKGTEATIKADPYSRLYIGSAKVTFNVKTDLNKYSNKNLGVLDEWPDVKKILELFNNATNLNLVINTDVTIEVLNGTEAIIKANPNSKLYTGFAKVTFNVKTDLNKYSNKNLGALDKKPDADKILELFNDATDLNLVINTDVTIEVLNGTEAIIKANPNSKLYTGFAKVTFNVKTDLNKYSNKNLGALDEWPSADKILELFNGATDLNLVINTDVTIEVLNGTEAIIQANPNSKLYTGFARVIFTIKKDLEDFNYDLKIEFLEVPNADQILEEFNNVNPIQVNSNDVTVENITYTNAFIKAKPDSKIVKGKLEVFFEVKHSKQRDTIYIDAKGKEQSTNKQDLSNEDIKEITQIGYYRTIENKIQMVKMPKIIEKVPNELPKQITSLKGVFESSKIFNQDISSWDVSNVTDMSGMFKKAENFNQNISNWNVSKVKNMSGMFESDIFFNQNLSNWDVSNVTDMSGMFRGAYHFNNGEEENTGKKKLDWKDKTKNVKNMSGMFEGATIFNQDISNWDVSNVTNMSSMFKQAIYFNQNISKWDVSNVTDMSFMFKKAKNFNQYLSGKVGDKVIGWETKKLRNVESMFEDAENFDESVIGFKLKYVHSTKNMFKEAKNFNHNVYWGDETENVEDMSGMFEGASSFNQTINPLDTSSVTSMANMFKYASNFNQKVSDWNVSNVTDMNGMFWGATNFDQEVSSWNVSNVTNMSRMFEDASKFDQEVWSWNVSNVTNMNQMFFGASNFDQRVSDWNVSKVANMDAMFKNAVSFDNSNALWKEWNVSQVTHMNQMFLNATNFKRNIRDWDVRNVEYHINFADHSGISGIPEYYPIWQNKR